MTPQAISFDQVYKTYGNGVEALENVSFSVDEGEFVFVTGASGSGKSTMIKLLLREINVTSGHISVYGEDITQLTHDRIPFLRRSYGVVFQDFKLLMDRTVYENVAFAMRVVGASPAEIRRRIPDVLFLTGLTAKAKVYPGELSGGEQQRVAIARAVANNPKILLADEPTGNLDPEIADQIMELFEDINEAGTTVIMITHAKDLVDRMHKRVISMERGCLVRDERDAQYASVSDQQNAQYISGEELPHED